MGMGHFLTPCPLCCGPSLRTSLTSTQVAGGHAVAVVGRGWDMPSLSTPAIEKMSFTAQERVSVSLIQDRGSLHQTQGEESSVMCARSEWDVFCRGTC